MQKDSALGRGEMGEKAGQSGCIGVVQQDVVWSGRARIAIVQEWQKLGKDGSGRWKMCQSIRDV